MAGDAERVRTLQIELIQSNAAHWIAVKRVTANSGKKTPGIDGVTWKTPDERLAAVYLVKQTVANLNRYKVIPILRVWIPKPGTDEKRPLGIPTVIDRTIQTLFIFAMEPVEECRADEDSFGFRPFRDCALAIARIRTLLDKKGAQNHYILDADIAKCFDSISHDSILHHARVPYKSVLRQWLKAPIVEEKKLSGGKIPKLVPNKVGTPQGGVLSPLLSNMVLNGIQKVVNDYNQSITPYERLKRFGTSSLLYLIRYADDFVILSPTTYDLDRVAPLINDFLKERGLKISETKTRTVSIHEGFDFLGWHIKRKKWTRNNKTSPGGETQRTKLIVEPQKQKVKQVMKTLNDQCFTQHNISYSRMIVKCNEIVMGWCIFYRYSYYSQEHFKALQHFIFNRTLHWLCKKHKCSVDSVIKRFCTKKDKPDEDNPRDINLFGVKRRSGKWKYAFRSWVFYTWVHDSINNKSRLHRIYDPTLTREVLVSQHKSGMNPYTTEGLHYWTTKKHSWQAINNFRANIYKKYDGKCGICQQPLIAYQEDAILDLSGHGDYKLVVDLHRVRPGKKGGMYDLSNTIPVHRECHPSADHYPILEGNDGMTEQPVKK